MKAAFELAIVIPLGPGCKQEFIEDTISSIRYHVTATHKIILADDSQKHTGHIIKQKFPEVDVVGFPTPMGKLCGLYITLSLAFQHALDKYEFEALLRIDTDALIIGKSPEKQALQMFQLHPNIGMAGQYPYDYNGRPWDTSWPGTQIWRMMHTRFFFSQPKAHLLLVSRYLRARKNKYSRGESVFGGACFFSVACLKALREKGLLPNYSFRNLELEEDHLFSLLVKSVGFGLGSLSGEGQPFGCAWKGLPASPLELSLSGKKIIHSTRYWQELDENDIRTWFRDKRGAAKGPIVLTINN